MQKRSRLKSSIEFTPETAKAVADARMEMRLRGYKSLSASTIIGWLISERLDLAELEAWAIKRARIMERDKKREKKS
jgi:hypothetical protein